MSFDVFLQAWVWAAVPIGILAIYLTINKIWIRRHEKVVAESVSVAAKFLAVFASLPFLVLYLTDGSATSSVKTLSVLLADAFLVLVGIGYWVEGRRDYTVWHNIKSALRLERKEVTVLLRDVFHPVAAQQLMQIMCDFAMIDRKLDKREKEFIEAFSRRWHIDMDKFLERRADHYEDTPATFNHLREGVEEYLALAPPVKQARQLGQVLSLLTQIDNTIADEEAIVLDELLGLIDNYTDGNSEAAFVVLIAPQSVAQVEALSAMQPPWPKEKRLGGEVVLIGRYYSGVYAQAICNWYRDNGYLTITVREKSTIVT